MKRFKLFLAVVAAIAVAACVRVGSDAPFTVTVPLTADDNSMMAYLVDFDSGEKIDSTIVDNGMAVFRGSVSEPKMARVILGGANLGTFVLEPGEIDFDTAKKEATGTPLNARLNAISDSTAVIESAYQNLQRDSTFEARATELQNRYNAYMESIVKENSDNPIGLYYFLQLAYDIPDLKTLDGELAKYPAFASCKRVKDLKNSFEAKEATSAGHKFRDFSVAHHEKGDSTVKLSDYVGRGKWILVDFWASWCGPCIRETKVIKEVLEAYGPKGLEVVGVAVWDEPENSLAAVAEHQLPWPQILNTGTTATDLYGIMGIPCILLVDPEGNIVARDIRDESLRQAVARALDPAPADKN